MEPNRIAARIRERRRALGLRQEDVAAQLHVTRQAVSLWEQGRTEPDLATLAKLAQVLQCAPAELLGEAPLPRPEDGPQTRRLRLAAVVLAGCAAVVFAIHGVLSLFFSAAELSALPLWSMVYRCALTAAGGAVGIGVSLLARRDARLWFLFPLVFVLWAGSFLPRFLSVHLFFAQRGLNAEALIWPVRDLAFGMMIGSTCVYQNRRRAGRGAQTAGKAPAAPESPETAENPKPPAPDGAKR